MKKGLITIAIIAIIAAFGWMVYRLYGKGKKEAAPLPSPEPPPPGSNGLAGQIGGLYNPDEGTGKTAVEKRMAEIRKNPGQVQYQILPGENPDRLFLGLENQALSAWLLNNVSISTGSVGVENVPFDLNAAQRSAVSELSKISYTGPAYWIDLERAVNAATEIRKTTGVRLFSENHYNPKDLNALRLDVFESVLRVAGFKGKGYSKERGTKAVKMLLVDLRKLGLNWLSISDDLNAAIKRTAITDLQKSGWKFVGYDQPI